MTLKRTGFKPRTTPMKQSSGFKPKVDKPPKGPKPKKCANRACRAPYIPDPKQLFKVWCSDDCGAVIALDRIAKQKAVAAKKERAQDRQRKRELTSPAKLAEPVRKLTQRLAVLRDHSYGCISCDKGPHWDGVWHGGHYKSVGSNSALQFNLLNVHKQCSQCNFFRGGQIIDYEPRLRAKIGNDRVDWLKNHPRSREYTPEYLDRLAKIRRKQIRRLERRLGLCK